MEGFNRFAEIAAQLDTALRLVPKKTAFDIQAGYAANAPRDTGFMVNSAYVVTADSSTYGQASPTRKDSYLLPQVDAPSDKYTAMVGVGANYAEFVEMGTVHMAAQPAFYPAVDAAKPGLDAAFAAIVGALK